MGWRSPKNPQRGVDFAGEVLEVGKGVTGFKPGDRVFGVAPGSLAEYAWARQHRIDGQRRPGVGVGVRLLGLGHDGHPVGEEF